MRRDGKVRFTVDDIYNTRLQDHIMNQPWMPIVNKVLYRLHYNNFGGKLYKDHKAYHKAVVEECKNLGLGDRIGFSRGKIYFLLDNTPELLFLMLLR